MRKPCSNNPDDFSSNNCSSILTDDFQDNNTSIDSIHNVTTSLNSSDINNNSSLFQTPTNINPSNNNNKNYAPNTLRHGLPMNASTQNIIHLTPVSNKLEHKLDRSMNYAKSSSKKKVRI